MRGTEFMSLSAKDVTVIDIAPFFSGTPGSKSDVAAAMAQAFEHSGFAAIVGHGVDPALIKHARSVAHDFFRLPHAEKIRVMLPQRVKTHGYIPLGVESVAATLGEKTPSDLCEALVFGGIRFDELPPVNDIERRYRRDNLWPHEPFSLRDAFTSYYWRIDKLADVLMRIAALALDLPEDWFQQFCDRRISTMRAVLYPEPTNDPLSGQLRYGAHRDYGGLTILHQDQAIGALQVRLPDGRWIDVRAPEGAFIVNVGDLMARWTNDRWLSALHRVVNPPTGASNSRRLSLVMFTGPNYDAMIDCIPTCTDDAHPPKYPAVMAIEHTRMKIDQSMISAEVDAA
jgi:isopenicillin N synthase-like dioxygenase